ncbi:putative type VI secretion system effector [Burkholderia sp. S171]|uniref:putative type VI secretion system effector n=1 Tax=Burkholderia sp. S171 TaxID=1641860 RepID=UPI0020B1050D|nr:putative type VI secretion system effector [Burkholderia sp. S171]
MLITPADRRATGAAAILAALAGQGGAAVAGLNAMNIREEADFVEFELNGEPVEGWLTFAPFKNGDEVTVVASRENGGWHAFGVMRSDYVTALHPCCSRGRYAHFKATVKWWLIISSVLMTACLGLFVIVGTFSENLHLMIESRFLIPFAGGNILFLAISGLIAINRSRKFMPAVRLAESIFAGFGWKNVKNIDLPAITKKYKLPGEGLEVGMLYFRCGKDSPDERLTGPSRI